MRFANPQWLWLLAPVPALVLGLTLHALRQNRRAAAALAGHALLPVLVSGFRPARTWARTALLSLAVICSIVALARPQMRAATDQVNIRGFDVFIAIDTSRSMLATDTNPDRFTRAKLAAMELINTASEARFGLIPFAGTAFLQCPLTHDRAALQYYLDSIRVEVLPHGGTALASVIRTALASTNLEPHVPKALVILSDGEDHEPGAVEAAREAAAAGLRIFCIGFGSAEGDIIRITNATGQPDFVRDRTGAVVKSRLDEELLRSIAAAGAGFYVHGSTPNAVEVIYKEGLSRLPTAELASMRGAWRELYAWPLTAALVLLVLERVVPGRARTPRAQPNKPPLLMVLTGVFLCSAATGAPAPLHEAYRLYMRSNYTGALRIYEELARKKPNDPQIRFNAGAAAFMAGDHQKAVRYFTDVITNAHGKLTQPAFYNRGNSHYRLGEQTTDLTLKRRAWEQALADYQCAVNLDTNDHRARANYEFVKRKLEELPQPPREAGNQGQQQPQQNSTQPDPTSAPNNDVRDRNDSGQPAQSSTPAHTPGPDQTPQVRTNPFSAENLPKTIAGRLLDAHRADEDVFPFLPPHMDIPPPEKDW